MADKIGSNGPVFDPKTGDFLDNPYETAQQSKNVTEIRWVPLVAAIIPVVLLWIGFAAVGWPLLIPIMGTILVLIVLGSFSWISNSK